MISDPIIEPFFIEIEEDQFTLKETCVVKEGDNAGNTYLQTCGYFTSFEACIKKIVRMKIAREDETLSLEGFLKRYLEEFSQIDLILKKLEQ